MKRKEADARLAKTNQTVDNLANQMHLFFQRMQPMTQVQMVMSDKCHQSGSESPLQGGHSSAHMGAMGQMRPMSMDPRESDSAITPPPAAVSNSQYRKMT